MKKLLIPLILLAAMACKEDPIEPDPETGCQTGILKTTGQREFIRCCKKIEHMAGNYEPNGGLPDNIWDKYTDIEWAFCDECK